MKETAWNDVEESWRLRVSKQYRFLVVACAAGLLAGCIGPPPDPEVTPSPAPPDPKIDFTASAGVPKERSADTKFNPTVVALTSRKVGPARPDPFALKADERAYDTEQNSERIFGTIGGWQNEFIPPNPADEAPPRIVEPQPYRRLSGVVVGDSVLALIDMGNGQSYIIRPGQSIPNSEWRVESIDMDKAVLVRSGDALPKEIVVRLELPPPNGMGAANPAGAFNPGGTGAPGGFNPGGLPPGFGGQRGGGGGE